MFAHLQAPYRAEIAARAELAELDRSRQVTERRAETERLSREAQLEAERATRMLQARTEAEATEVEAREAQRKAEMNAAAARRTTELERDRILHQIGIAEEHRRAKAASEAAALEAEVTRVEAVQRAALLELEHARVLANQRQASDLELRRAQAEIDLELRRREADARAHEQALDAEHQRKLAELEQLLGQSRALRELVSALPAMAGSLAPRAETLHVTQIGDGKGMLDAVPAALAQVLALAHSFGLELPNRGT